MALFKVGGIDLNLKVVGAGVRTSLPFTAERLALQSIELTDRELIDLGAFESAGWRFLSVRDRRVSELELLDRSTPNQTGLLARHEPSGGLVVIEPRILLKLAPGATLSSIDHRLNRFLRVEKLDFGENLYEAYLQAGPGLEGALQGGLEGLRAEIQARRDLLFAEPSILYHLDRSLQPSADRLGTPLARASDNDVTDFAENDRELDRVPQWHWERIRLVEAWNIAGSRGAGKRVGVIDLGFGSDPQMGNVVRRVQVDAQGTASTVASLPTDDHGIACAGLIGARRDRRGVNGAAPECDLILVALNTRRIVGPKALAKAITICALGERGQPGADVISCSLGFDKHSWEIHSVVRDAIDTAYRQGRNKRGTPIFWAVFNEDRQIQLNSLEADERLLCIAQSDRNDERFRSGFGDDLDLIAPGKDVPVLGSDPSGWRVDPKTGSSLAAPCTAGVAALVLAVNDALTAGQVEKIITRRCDPLGDTVPNSLTGWGRLNARRAVELALQVRNGADLDQLLATPQAPHLPPPPPPEPPGLHG